MPIVYICIVHILMIKIQKQKIILSEEEPKQVEEAPDYRFRFGKLKHVLASQVVSIETAKPKDKQKQNKTKLFTMGIEKRAFSSFQSRLARCCRKVEG